MKTSLKSCTSDGSHDKNEIPQQYYYQMRWFITSALCSEACLNLAGSTSWRVEFTPNPQVQMPCSETCLAEAVEFAAELLTKNTCKIGFTWWRLYLLQVLQNASPRACESMCGRQDGRHASVDSDPFQHVYLGCLCHNVKFNNNAQGSDLCSVQMCANWKSIKLAWEIYQHFRKEEHTCTWFLHWVNVQRVLPCSEVDQYTRSLRCARWCHDYFRCYSSRRDRIEAYICHATHKFCFQYPWLHAAQECQRGS